MRKSDNYVSRVKFFLIPEAVDFCDQTLFWLSFVHVSKLSFVFREVMTFFHGFENSHSRPYTYANFFFRRHRARRFIIGAKFVTTHRDFNFDIKTNVILTHLQKQTCSFWVRAWIYGRGPDFNIGLRHQTFFRNRSRSRTRLQTFCKLFLLQSVIVNLWSAHEFSCWERYRNLLYV